MIGADNIRTEFFAWCFTISLFVILTAMYGKQLIAWLIMKLYWWFVGSRDHHTII